MPRQEQRRRFALISLAGLYRPVARWALDIGQPPSGSAVGLHHSLGLNQGGITMRALRVFRAVGLFVGFVVSTTAYSQVMCPNGSFVSRGPCTMCPDGSFVGGGASCQLAPNGQFVAQDPRNPRPAKMAPDGNFVSGGRGTTMCPDGSFVAGSRCVMAPNGKFVGQ